MVWPAQPSSMNLRSVTRPEGADAELKIKKGTGNEVLTKKNLRRIRPGNGLLPKYYEMLLGKKIKSDTVKGTPVSWDLILDD